MPTPSAWIRSTLSNTLHGEPGTVKAQRGGQSAYTSTGDDDVVHGASAYECVDLRLGGDDGGEVLGMRQAGLGEPVEADAAIAEAEHDRLLHHRLPAGTKVDAPVDRAASPGRGRPPRQIGAAW